MCYNENLTSRIIVVTRTRRVKSARCDSTCWAFRKKKLHCKSTDLASQPDTLLYRGTWCLCQSRSSNHARRYCLRIARCSVPSFDSEKRHGEVEDRIVVRGSSRVCGANWEEVRIGQARLERPPPLSSKLLFSHFVDGARTRRGEYGLGISEMASKQVVSSLSSTCKRPGLLSWNLRKKIRVLFVLFMWVEKMS